MAHSRKLEVEQGFTYVHAFEDDLVIAGQGTIGQEIASERPDTTVIVIPIGGGGIISGIAIAAKHLIPNVRVIGVEAAQIPVISRSLTAGEPIELPFRPTIADGIAVKRAGEKTLGLIREFVDDVVEVSEDEIARGVFHCIQNNHLVVEGAGAAGIAALLAGKINLSENDKICAVLCGGNIDANLLTRILEQVLVRKGRYVIFKVLVDDRPGSLSRLLDTAASQGANVIEVFHQRAMRLAPLGRVGIEMLLEVKDEEHGQRIHKFLQESGYHVEKEGRENWEKHEFPS